MLQKKSVEKAVFELLYSLQQKEYLKEFYLVGGTGLALIMGHRKSEDIDLFTPIDFNSADLLEKLESDFNYSMDYIETNTVKGSISGVKVDLLAHKYPLVQELWEIEDLRIASMDDISAMKVNSIVNDGTRAKDFIDIYFLVNEQGYTVRKLLENYKIKYGQRNAMHALKSLNYFEDVDIDNWPVLLKNKDLSWNEIKKGIDRACADYIRTIS